MTAIGERRRSWARESHLCDFTVWVAHMPGGPDAFLCAFGGIGRGARLRGFLPYARSLHAMIPAGLGSAYNMITPSCGVGKFSPGSSDGTLTMVGGRMGARTGFASVGPTLHRGSIFQDQDAFVLATINGRLSLRYEDHRTPEAQGLRAALQPGTQAFLDKVDAIIKAQ